jgi:CRISP-associated protein Cas1
MSKINNSKYKQIVLILGDYNDEIEVKLNNKNLVTIKNSTIISIPISKIQFVIIVGDNTITTNIIKYLSSEGVIVFLSSISLNPISYILPANSQKNKKLRINQLKVVSNPNLKLEISKKIILKKIKSQGFNHSKDLASVNSIQELISIEGGYSQKYFKAKFDKYGWIKREPQSKKDMINVLMDLGYTLLHNLVKSYLIETGIEINLGILHSDTNHKEALAKREDEKEGGILTP